MKVSELVVVNFCDSFAQVADTAKPHQMLEDRQVAYGLYLKHKNRTDGTAPARCWWIEVNNVAQTGTKATTKDGGLTLGVDYRLMLPAGAAFAGIQAGERNVGVYLIYHGKQSSDPNLFGVTPLGKADKKDEQAGRLIGLLEKLGIKPIRKLSIVACHADTTKENSRNFLLMVGRRIEAWGDDRPMIAGYDDYVTGGPDGHKLAGSGTTKVKATAHKHVWVYKTGLLSGGYKLVALEKSGWSDKVVLPTDSAAAVLPQ